jgi:hypothetical protein
MKLTNRLNLPQALVDAIRNDPYDNGGAWRSVTQLIAPPRQAILKKRHDHEIEEDVSDRLFALYGQIVHDILKRANTEDLVEHRLFTECRGKKISGGYDVLQLSKHKLIDWKFSTSWKAVGGDNHDWMNQVNLLALLVRRQLGVEIKELEIILLARDHSKLKAKREPKYPQHPVMRIPIGLWPAAQQDAYLDERVRLHLEAEEELPLCTREEKWQKKDVFAVCLKDGRQNVSYAAKYNAIPNGLHPSREEAMGFINSKPGSDKYFIQHRKGENTRCLGYCSAASFCSQSLQDSQEVTNGPKR